MFSSGPPSQPRSSGSEPGDVDVVMLEQEICIDPTLDPPTEPVAAIPVTQPLAWSPDLEDPAYLRERILELSRGHRRMQDLFSALSFALRSFKNLSQILELIAFVASQLTDAEGGALVLFNANGTVQLEQLHCADLDRRDQIRAVMERATHALSRGSAVAASRLAPIPVFEEDDSPLERQLDALFRRDLEADVQIFGTPLLIHNRPRGRLYVFSRQPNYRWTESRQQLLRTMADQAAVAIENDELTLELRKKVAQTRELEIGSQIQAQLLPRDCPHVPGIQLSARCRTANKVGGDFYDFIKLPPCVGSERWGIAIGDVMGKGVPAGLLMTMTRGMLRAEVVNQHSPARILEHLNQVMFSDLENSNRFISLFYSEYDPSSRRLCFSNAAHNPPLWWQAASGQVQPLDTAGNLVGLEAQGSYEEGCVQLRPGDVVVFYTDGFTEAANALGERFDLAGLEEAIRRATQRFQDPQAILGSLFEQVEAFQQGTPRQRRLELQRYFQEMNEDGILPDEFREDLAAVDDMTMIVLKVAAA